MSGDGSGDPEQERGFLFLIPWLIAATALAYVVVWVVRLRVAA